MSLARLTLLVVLMVSFGWFVQKAEAHTIQVDGAIGASLHTDPDDDPIANIPTALYFHFKDMEEKFKIENCDCVFTIEPLKNPAEKITISHHDIEIAGSKDLLFRHTFPKTALYKIEVTGSPKEGSSFQSFKLSYDLRVARTADNSPIATVANTTTHLLHHYAHLVLLYIAIFISIGIVIRDKIRQKRIMRA